MRSSILFVCLIVLALLGLGITQSAGQAPVKRDNPKKYGVYHPRRLFAEKTGSDLPKLQRGPVADITEANTDPASPYPAAPTWAIVFIAIQGFLFGIFSVYFICVSKLVWKAPYSCLKTPKKFERTPQYLPAFYDFTKSN
ncbi:unnamed protein product, partial [Mesorhabditis spiculigera]